MTSRLTVFITLILTLPFSNGGPQSGLIANILRPVNTGRYYQQRQNVGTYSPNYDSSLGQYVHDDSGSYYHDDSGSYRHDDSGAYVPDNNPYIHQDGGLGNYYNDLGSNGGIGGVSGGIERKSGSSTNAGLGSALGGGARPIASTAPTVIAGSGGSTPRPSASGISTDGRYGQPVTLQQGNSAGLYDNRNYAIIRKVEQVEQDGYHYLYETENGILAEEEGHLANKGAENEAIRAAGYFTYTGPDNVVYTVEYTADENGFVPRGAHLPTPPPIPEAIARSLEYQKSIGEL